MHWLTTEEAAKELGVSPHTLKAWRQKKRGPLWTRIGGQARYTREAIEKWIKQRLGAPIAPRQQ